MKRARFKNSFRALLSLCTAILLFTSMIPVTSIAAGEDGYYTATRAEVGDASNIKTGGITYVTGTVEPDAVTTLTPTVPAGYGRWLWDSTYVDDYNGKAAHLQIQYILSGVTTTADSALLFYVKLPAEAPETMMGFRIQSVGTNLYTLLDDGKPLYVLTEGATAWKSLQVTRPSKNGDDEKGNYLSKDAGYITLDAGFEGWVRIPMSSTNGENLGELSTIRVSVPTVDQTFAEDGLYLGSCHVVNEGASDFLKLSTDGGATTQPLFARYTAMVVPELKLYDTGSVTSYEEFTKPTDATPYILGGFVKLSWNAALGSQTLVRLQTDQYYDFSSETQAFMFYIKTPDDGSVETKIKLSASDSKSNYVENDESYYILNKADGFWSESTVSSNLVVLPVGFEGWVRIPYSIVDQSTTLSQLSSPRFYFQKGTAAGDYYIGAYSIVEDFNGYKLQLAGSDGIGAMFPTYNVTPLDENMSLDLPVEKFYGCEANVNVTLSGDKTIGDYNGHKLYYQYTPKGATEPVKMALQRVSAGTHDDPDNVTQFVIPYLSGTDGEIVAGDVAEDVTVLGTSAWYEIVDGVKTYTYKKEEGGEDYFKIRFMCRAARTIEDGAYKLSTMRVRVTAPGGKTVEYPIQDTLADVCTDYADFTKVLNGPVKTKGGIAYQVQAVATYAATDGTSEPKTVESELFNSLSYEAMPKPQ